MIIYILEGFSFSNFRKKNMSCNLFNITIAQLLFLTLSYNLKTFLYMEHYYDLQQLDERGFGI